MGVGIKTRLALGVLGKRDPYTQFETYGRSDSISGSYSVVSTTGQPAVFPQTPQFVNIVAGGNAADSEFGTGARTIVVIGINENLQVEDELVVLAGAAESAPTTAKFWRVVHAYVKSVGVYGGSNVGVIDIENEDGDIAVCIPANEGQSALASFSVPEGFTALIRGGTLSAMTTAKPLLFRVELRELFNETTNPKPIRVLRDYGLIQPGISPLSTFHPLFIPGLSDVYITAMNASGGTASGAAAFDFVLIPGDSADLGLAALDEL